MKWQQSIKYKEVKTGLVKLVCGKRPMKRRGVSSRELTIIFCWKMIKMASQRKKERFDDIYRANTIFTKINFQDPSPKGSSECR